MNLNVGLFLQIEKEVIDCMTRALKYLDVELNNPSADRYSLAKYRAATIHHRLASLLHNTFRTQVSRKKLLIAVVMKAVKSIAVFLA